MVLCATLLAAGCGASQRTYNIEQRSVAEYDLARDLWLNRREPRAALGHALQALELDDENADAAHLVALLHLALCERSPVDCRLDQAETHARLALTLRSDFREARNTLAVSQIHAGKAREAVETLRVLTTDLLYATPEIAWGNLGWAYLELGELPPALEALQRAVRLEPNFCVGHYRMGLVEERAGKLAEAVTSFTRALDAAGGRCRGLQAAYAGRARSQLALGHTDEARRDLKDCTRLGEATEDGARCAELARRLP